MAWLKGLVVGFVTLALVMVAGANIPASLGVMAVATVVSGWIMGPPPANKDQPTLKLKRPGQTIPAGADGGIIGQLAMGLVILIVGLGGAVLLASTPWTDPAFPWWGWIPLLFGVSLLLGLGYLGIWGSLDYLKDISQGTAEKSGIITGMSQSRDIDGNDEYSITLNRRWSFDVSGSAYARLSKGPDTPVTVNYYPRSNVVESVVKHEATK